MADFIRINEHSSKGNLAISRKVIETIVNEAVLRVLNQLKTDTNKVKITKPSEIAFKKDGKVMINVFVSLKKKENPQDTCLKIQEEIARDLAIYTESLPFEIIVSITDIK